MGGPRRSTRGGLRLWCFARPHAAAEAPEKCYKGPIGGPRAARGRGGRGKNGQDAASVPARDSQDDLTAYLGKAHRCASSTSILTTAASLSDAERRLKGLPEGEALPGGAPLARTPASSPPPSTPAGHSSVAGSVCGDGHPLGEALGEGAEARQASLFAAGSFRSKASSQAVGTPVTTEYANRMVPESSGSSAVLGDGPIIGGGNPAGDSALPPTAESAPGEPRCALPLGPQTVSHSEASEVTSHCSHSLPSDDGAGTDGRGHPAAAAAAVRSLSLTRLVLGDLTQQLSMGGGSEGGRLSRVHSRTLILSSLSLSQQPEEDTTNRGANSPTASTAGSHRSAVQRRHTLSAMVLLSGGATDSDSDGEEEGRQGAAGKGQGPVRALSLPPTLRRAPSARSLQRCLSDVFEGHHVPLQKLRRQMGDPKEPPGDLLSLMARRVFSQQDVLARMGSDGLVSHLDARSSLLIPAPTAEGPLSDVAAVAPAPKLAPIRTRPMPESANHD